MGRKDDIFDGQDKQQYWHAAKSHVKCDCPCDINSNWPDIENKPLSGLDFWAVDNDSDTLFTSKSLEQCVLFMTNYPGSFLRHVVMSPEELEVEKEARNKVKDYSTLRK